MAASVALYNKRLTAAAAPQRRYCSSSTSTPMRHRHRRAAVVVAAGMRARWLLDARYGCKADATQLLVEWVQTVGAEAGGADLLPRARVSTGALGAPESRLELELSFGSMADWEAFLARIPPAAHKAWSQRVASMVVDGSPRWEVYREVDVGAAPAGAASGSVSDFSSSGGVGSGVSSSSSGSSSSGGGSAKLVFADKVMPEDVALFERSQQAAAEAAADAAVTPITDSGTSGGDDGNDSGVMLDWKGEPLKVSPGDKLPGIKFL
jgi:uncharacterized membrane protein YgcG